MGTSEVHAVFDLLYAFPDDVFRVTGVRMPSGVDPQSVRVGGDGGVTGPGPLGSAGPGLARP